MAASALRALGECSELRDLCKCDLIHVDQGHDLHLWDRMCTTHAQ